MTTTPTLHAQVLALRRTQSARAVAQALNIPLGTVKAVSSRAGLTRDNARLREFFRLPKPVASTCTALQPPVAPPEPVAVTGDRDLDAMLWLRQVVQTGDAALIAKAQQAAERIKTPAQELEKRYGDFLMRQSGGNTAVSSPSATLIQSQCTDSGCCCSRAKCWAYTCRGVA